MKPSRFQYDLGTLRGDLFGSLTSAVVALPVALAFGIASGMGAAAGLYSVIAVGFFAAVFGGTRSQISGPTGPMTIAMAVVITTHASTLGEALTVVVLGGLIQILLGVLRMGRFVVYTPYVVISGFMSGVGLIIMLIQALPFLGAPPAPGGPMGALRAIPDAVAGMNTSAFALALVALGVAILWPRRLARFLPGLLVALLAGTALGVLWLTDVPVIGEIPRGLPSMHLELPTLGFLVRALQPALILALLGSVDSLLTSLVADSLTGTQHNPNRELVGQGIGNVVSGLFGGLPGAGATMGTVTNIRAGGTTQVSGALRAVLVLALLLGLGGFVAADSSRRPGRDSHEGRLGHHRLAAAYPHSPHPAGTSVRDRAYAGAHGVRRPGHRSGHRADRGRAWCTRASSNGLELDSVVSVPLLDHVFFAGRGGSAHAMDRYAARVGLVRLNGSFTVASSQKLFSVIGGDIKDHDVVIFDFSGVTYIDDSAAMTISRLLSTAAREDTECIVTGLSGKVGRTLHALDILRDLPEGHEVRTMDDARAVAIGLLKG